VRRHAAMLRHGARVTRLYTLFDAAADALFSPYAKRLPRHVFERCCAAMLFIYALYAYTLTLEAATFYRYASDSDAAEMKYASFALRTE